MILIFTAEVFTLRPLVFLGLLVLVVSIIAWHWPSKVPTTIEEEEQFERDHGIAVRPDGSRAVTKGGNALLILILAIALGSFLLSYFYIRLENPEWPPDNIPLPDLFWAAASSLVLLASAGVIWWALRSIRAGNQLRLRLGFGAAFVLGTIAVGSMIFTYTQLNYGWTLNAYASLFYLIGGFMIAVMIGALLMNALVQFWSWRGEYSARRHLGVETATTYWLAAVAGWLITFGVLYLAPYLT